MENKLRWFFLIVSALLFANVVLGLNDVDYYYFDEPIYVDASEALATRTEVQNWEHPPLAKYFILAGRTLLENKVVGARAPALIALFVFLVFLALTAEHLFKGYFIPGLAGAFSLFVALTDPLLVNMSKIVMLDIYVLAFTMAGIFFLLQFLRGSKRWAGLAVGLCFGLAMACKWSALPIFIVCFAILFRRRAPLGLLSLTLGLSVYALTFVPFLFLKTPGPVRIIDLLRLHGEMLNYHSHFLREMPHQSAWWSWPLQWNPVWLLSEHRSGVSARGLLAVGNLLTYTIGLVGLGAWVFRKKDLTAYFLFAGYLSTLIFWAVSGRMAYSYYYLMCAPFLYLGAMAVVGENYVRRPTLAYVTALAVFGFFAYFWPVIRFIEVSRSYIAIP